MSIHLNPHTGYISHFPSRARLEAHSVHFVETEHYYRLLFICGGEHELHSKAQSEVEGTDNMVYLIPPSSFCTINVGAQALDIVDICFRPDIEFCAGLCPKEKKKASRKEECSTVVSARPRRKPSSRGVPLSDNLKKWLDSFSCLLDFPDIEQKYIDYRLSEFFLLLRLDYTDEVVQNFLRYYHCRIKGFREHFTSLYNKDLQLEDLYHAGEDLGMNPLALKRSFVDEFGVTPKEWLQEQKAKLIYHEIKNTDKPFKQLSWEYGFCSLSYFGTFCKQMLGNTPLKLRKG